MIYHETLNGALLSENINMTTLEVSQLIGHIDYEETKRFQFENKQVVIYRMPSGRYEITSYSL